MDRPGVWQVLEGSGEQGKMEKSGCKVICGAPSTLTVKGLMMMMMIQGVVKVLYKPLQMKIWVYLMPGTTHTHKKKHYKAFLHS